MSAPVGAPSQAPRTLSGTLAKTPMPRLLVSASNARVTGTLDLQCKETGEVGTLSFVRGQVTRVRTSAAIAYLGSILYELGFIDDAELNESLRELARTKWLHGEILLTRAAITLPQLAEGLHEQTTRKLVHLFSMPVTTSYHFEADVDHLANYGGTDWPHVDPVAAVWRGVRDGFADEDVDAAMEKVRSSAFRLVHGASVAKLDFLGSGDERRRVSAGARAVDRGARRGCADRRASRARARLLPLHHEARRADGAERGAPRVPPAVGRVDARPDAAHAADGAGDGGAAPVAQPVGLAFLDRAARGERVGAVARGGAGGVVREGPDRDAGPGRRDVGHADHDGRRRAGRANELAPAACELRARADAPPDARARERPRDRHELLVGARAVRVAGAGAHVARPGARVVVDARGHAGRRVARGGREPEPLAGAPRRARRAQGEHPRARAGRPARGLLPAAQPHARRVARSIDAAYEALRTLWDPGLLPPALEEARDDCAFVMSCLAEAHVTLSDPRAREEYVARLGTSALRSLADQYGEDLAASGESSALEGAYACFAKSDVERAERLCKRALKQESDSPKALALLAWLEAQKPGNVGVDATRPRIAMLDRAIRADESFERAYQWRAQLHKRCENHQAALRDFHRVVELNPKNVDAMREIRLYEMRIRKNSITMRGLK